MEMIITVLLYPVGMFILYVVIEMAVRQGINTSMIGKYLKQKEY